MFVPCGRDLDSILLLCNALNPAVGIETIARWSALFLRANMLKDLAAFDYIYSQGDALDPNVRVTTVAVPEPSFK